MPRPHRYTDDPTPGGHVLEVMRKVVAGTYLMRPEPALNALLVGAYGYALSHPRFAGRIRMHDLVAQSGHFHYLATAACQDAIGDFEEFVGSLLAKAIGRLRGWRGRVWDSRYSLSQVFPSKQRDRARYLWGQGLPENLYRSPSENPCVSSYKAWSAGQFRLTGEWYDGPAMREAGVDWDDPEAADYARDQVIELFPLPIDEGKTKRQLVWQARAIGKSLIKEHSQRRAEDGVDSVLGPEAMQAVDPFDRPRRTKKGRAAPLAIGTPAEVAAFEARHRAAGEARDALLVLLARHPKLADYPEQAAMPSVLRAAIRRANQEDLKAVVVLAKAGRLDEAAARISETPFRRSWPDLPPAVAVPRGGKPRWTPRPVRPKRRRPQPKPSRRRRFRGRRLALRPRPGRSDRAARRLRAVGQPPLKPTVIEIPLTSLARSGANPRTYLLLWVRCCVAADEDGDPPAQG